MVLFLYVKELYATITFFVNKYSTLILFINIINSINILKNKLD